MKRSQFDLSPGDRFERVVIIERTNDKIYASCRKAQYVVACDCGTTKVVFGNNLLTGNTTSCGCRNRDILVARVIDLTGQRYGRWVVRQRVGNVLCGLQSLPTWAVTCDCGTEAVVRGDLLRAGHSTSCGCKRVDALREASTTHGHAPTGNVHPLYRTWQNMIQRCSNPDNPSWTYYGGRGITVCERWRGANGFPNFLIDMGDKPASPDGWVSNRPYWTLDRIDPDGNYEPDNCRWADPVTQSSNQSRYAKETP